MDPEDRISPSFCQSFRLSGHFLGNVSLFFSKFWHGARNPNEVARDRAEFSGKFVFASKLGKIDQKWTENGCIEFIKKFGR